MDPLTRAALATIMRMIPALVEWAAGVLTRRGDPEAELEVMMLGAEEAARRSEERKFGDGP